MDLSGIIFVVLALAWALFLIPKALKHHDEIARTRSIDRFSTAMRVLARREQVNTRDARLVVTPPRPAGSARMLVPNPAAAAVAAVEASTQRAESEPVRRRGSAALPRAASRAAARRRRHVLALVIALGLIIGGVAFVGLLPWWSVAIAAAPTPLYLYLCRRQVRRDHRAPGSRTREDSHSDQGLEVLSPDEDTVPISSTALRAAIGAGSVGEADAAAAHAIEMETMAVAVQTVDGGSLWDPLPVTLPTYVNKSRARRTVRTIDLTEPGTWTSGRSEADSQLVEEANATQNSPAAQRAANS